MKFDRLVHRFTPEYLSTTVDNKEIHDKSAQAYFRGACQIPGARFNIGYGLVTEPCLVDPYPHKHFADEYLIFGSETLCAKDWDAEIEITLGLGNDAETYVIDRPATVYVPAGIWHCPLNFKRIGTPVFFQPALLQGMFGGIYLIDGEEKELYYNGQIDCVLEPGKKCVACKRCLARDWQ